MEWIGKAVDLFLHLDRHLGEIIQQYGGWTYALLTLVVFCETGLVVTPFLPGDSLLFAAGAFAALPGSGLRLGILFALLASAAILGDTVNYWIGHRIGPAAFEGRIRFLKKSHLDRTHVFYEKYGGKTIIIARFVPIVRTFAPFVAGVGSMSYGRFFTYNVVGGVAWVAICLFSGYFFGNLPVVKANFSLVIIAIVFISVLPAAFEILRHRLAARRAAAAGSAADAPAIPGD
jgi:membrane-associated protein